MFSVVCGIAVLLILCQPGESREEVVGMCRFSSWSFQFHAEDVHMHGMVGGLEVYNRCVFNMFIYICSSFPSGMQLASDVGCGTDLFMKSIALGTAHVH